jgi:hypothetical protein
MLPPGDRVFVVEILLRAGSPTPLRKRKSMRSRSMSSDARFASAKQIETGCVDPRLHGFIAAR